MGKRFNVWAFGDAHVATDKKHRRESLAEAIAQSEFGGAEGGPAFDWDIALDVGDMSGAQAVPNDEEGPEIVRQFAALRKHRREDIYSLCGNHDRNGLNEAQAWWWRKWVDPMGANTQFSRVNAPRRPYAIEGTWERYSFRAGNTLFLIMSDINEPTQTVGRGDLGGNPAGVVSGETFRWWVRMVEANQDSIIISAHHYMLKDTTVASGAWEGMVKTEGGQWAGHYHGYKPQGAPEGASYLYFVDSKPDAQAFEKYLEAHPGAIDLWVGGHTHTHVDDTRGGKSHLEAKWGVTFLNAAGLTRYHGKTCMPMSRLLTFADGLSHLRVRCYLHTSEHARQGWYRPEDRTVPLRAAFRHPRNS